MILSRPAKIGKVDSALSESDLAMVKAWNGEFMLFDQNALLNELITVNELDSFDLQVTGRQEASAAQNITLASGAEKPMSASFETRIKNTASQLTTQFNTRNFTGLASLCASDVAVHISNSTTTGKSAVTALLNKYHVPFPDLLAHNEFIIAQGYLTAVETIIQGTRTGEFVASNGTVVPADGKVYRTRVMRWFRFGDEVLVREIWEVGNWDDLIVNTMG